jgi:hypothetical protein
MLRRGLLIGAGFGLADAATRERLRALGYVQ